MGRGYKRNRTSKEMEKETTMYGYDERQTARRERQAERLKRAQERKAMRTPNTGRIIPQGSNEEASRFTRPQIRVPESALKPGSGKYTIPGQPEIKLPEFTTNTGKSGRAKHSKSELDARKKLTKEQKELIRHIERTGDGINDNGYRQELKEIAKTLGIELEDSRGHDKSTYTIAEEINDVIGSRM